MRAGLVDGDVTLNRLAGGVSSDIWAATSQAGTICVKRALAQLKVASEWFAPIGRNADEVAWFEVVGAKMPEAVPRILAHDPSGGIFAMSFFDPGINPNWKAQLSAGIVDIEFAAQVGDRLGRIHCSTACEPILAARFANNETFFALRIEPYLLATAIRNKDVADQLRALAYETGRTNLALVHGDVSPKNILVGEAGPIFLDAECATWGDPAFDVAFCLNHLLLKSQWRRAFAEFYFAAFDALVNAYFLRADWEPRAGLEARASRLLPALLLARVDGKSPVEYLASETDKEAVRTFAKRMLATQPSTLEAIRHAWAKHQSLGHLDYDGVGGRC